MPSSRPARPCSQVDFIPANPTTFLAVARGMKLKLRGKKTGFLIRGSDQRGAIAGVMTKLAHAKINVTAVDAVTAGAGRIGPGSVLRPGAMSP